MACKGEKKISCNTQLDPNLMYSDVWLSQSYGRAGLTWYDTST